MSYSFQSPPMFNIIPFMCNIYNTNHYMQNQKIAGYFTPATALFIHMKAIHFILSSHFPHPYKNRSTHIYHPTQFAPLYRTSSPLIAVPKALPWQTNSTFIIVLFLLVLPRNALFYKDSWEFCDVLDFTPKLQIVVN